MTAESTPEDVIQAIRAHAFSYFSKPFDASNVIRMIAHALGIHAWEDGIEVLSARPEWIALRVRCRRITADRLLQFMCELEVDLPADERENIATAFREMLMNALEHGAGFDPDKTVDICYVRTSRVIIYQIRDPGEGFSFASLPHAAISNPPDAPAEHFVYRIEQGLRPGGFGILIVRNLVDELFYNEKGNEVLMIKYP
jgi:anti-sigma regulatory factor (Ser/Thr protein kinase)